MNYWIPILIGNLWVIASFFSQNPTHTIISITFAFVWVGMAVVGSTVLDSNKEDR